MMFIENLPPPLTEQKVDFFTRTCTSRLLVDSEFLSNNMEPSSSESTLLEIISTHSTLLYPPPSPFAVSKGRKGCWLCLVTNLIVAITSHSRPRLGINMARWQTNFTRGNKTP